MLVSPSSGLPLTADGPHSLSDGRERWPVIDRIPYLRTGREHLVEAALDALDAGDFEGALVLLLADQDDWWDGPAPAAHDLRRLIRDRDALTLRDAMGLLAFGRVADYFAHRWSDPTFMAGLALVDAHWNEPRTTFELACGIGHYLRELEAAGATATGGDVVFAKLWLARHWVVGPQTDLICFDARAPWPISTQVFDLCLCQDAFYFLEPKRDILGRLRAALAPGGTLLVGHVHNSEAVNASAGHGMSADQVAALFPDALAYDDAALTRAARDGLAPVSRSPAELCGVEAFALADGPARPPRAADGPCCRPRDGAALRRNPLYRDELNGDSRIAWPSARYRREYGDLATYPSRTALPERPQPGTWTIEQVRRREVVALPARW